MMAHRLLIALFLMACTDAGLEPLPPATPPVTDNLIRISGRVCTEPADISPFPVKLLFVLDQSASLQCTDSNNNRFGAVNQVIDDLYPLPNAFFGFIGFSSWSRKQQFTRNQDEIEPYLDPAQGLGPATDYQGSLASTLQMLEQDMIDSGPAQRARTRYVVVFVSDGMPEPRCRGGCEDDEERCTDGVDSDGDGLVDANDPDCADIDDNSLRPDNLYPFCNTDLPISDGTYVDRGGRCPEYNQPRQILQRVEELRTLELLYSVGEIVLHTVFITSPEEVIAANPRCGDDAAATFGYSAPIARELLSEMARVGGGAFRDVNIHDNDTSFLDFDFTSLRTPYHATAFVAYNENAISTTEGLIPDSDADGLSDAEEFLVGTRSDNPDSDDNDGYSDLFEARYQSNGFDPLDPDIPALRCEDPSDTDGDGIGDCEEAYLGLNERDPDTDGDRILDGVELRRGLDPSEPDADRDPDFDGIINRNEIQGNTNPLIVDGDRFQQQRVRYTLEDQGELPIVNIENGSIEDRRCYDFDVSNLELVVTDQSRDRGRNRLLMHVFGEPLGLSGSQSVIRQGCVEVKYPGEGVKRPTSGVVDLSQAGLGAIRNDLVESLASIRRCLGRDDLIRPDLEDVVEQCLPIRTQVGRVLFHHDELIDLIRRYYQRDLELALPDEPSDIFVPIEIFDPDTHCIRAWEIDRVRELAQIMAEKCQTCAFVAGMTPDSAEQPDGGTTP